MRSHSIATDSPIKKIVAEKIDKDDESAVRFMKCAYFLAKNELPKSLFSATIEFVDALGIEIQRASKPEYTHHTSVGEFQAACAKTISTDTVEHMKEGSGLYSIKIDESTDRGNKKRLILYAEFVNRDFKKETKFICNSEITTATADAETIVNVVLAELRNKGIDISGMIGISTDGASVMTGRKTGVVVRLREHIPNLIGTHCAAPRCALATSQAAKFITEIAQYSRTVGNVFYFFSASALRSNKLQEIQTILDLPELKYAEVHSVRCLSLDRAVRVLYRTYPALVTALEHKATSNATAKGLLHEVQQYKFIMLTHLLLDILPVLTRLSKAFQTESADFSVMSPMVESTVDLLTDMKSSIGMYVDQLDMCIVEEDEHVVYKRGVNEARKKAVDENVKVNVDGLEGFDCLNSASEDDNHTVNEVKLLYYEQQKSMLLRVMPDYIDRVIANLKDRFADNGVLSLFQIFVPACIVRAEREGAPTLLKFGLKELNDLLDKYEKSLKLDRDDCVSEYKQYRRLVLGSYSTLNLSTCVEAMFRNYQQIIPNVCKLLEVAVLIPMSSVSCERGFSTQNRILTRFRTRLSTQALNDLMRISEDGPSFKQFDFNRAVTALKKEKVRKLYA